jgi:hypothetical protein
MSRCKQCDEPLVEIDNYSERLIGCIECNQWTWRGSKRLIALPHRMLLAMRRASSIVSTLAMSASAFVSRPCYWPKMLIPFFHVSVV